MSPTVESLLVLVVILSAAALGMVLSRALPARHLGDSTRTHFTAAVSVVGTLTALVLGLAISNASNIRLSMLQDVMQLSSKIARIGGLLRNYGPEAGEAQASIRQFASAKLDDLFPSQDGREPKLLNLDTVGLLRQTQDRILALKPQTDTQRWLQTEALGLSGQIDTEQWAISEQEHATVPQGVVVIVTFWLGILFLTYGLFTPRHLTAVAAMMLSALAVAGAIFVILEARTPFTGLARISSAPLIQAVDLVYR